MDARETTLNLLSTLGQHLAEGQFELAYALITQEGQAAMNETLEAGWSRMMEQAEDPDTVEIEQRPEEFMFDAMAGWPDPKPGDIGWGYLPLVGDELSEAVSGIATMTEQGPRLRSVELGRP